MMLHHLNPSFELLNGNEKFKELLDFVQHMWLKPNKWLEGFVCKCQRLEWLIMEALVVHKLVYDRI